MIRRAVVTRVTDAGVFFIIATDPARERGPAEPLGTLAPGDRLLVADVADSGDDLVILRRMGA